MKVINHEIDSIEIISEKYFSYQGCDNCRNQLGNDVYKVKANFDNFTDYYNILLCDDCLNTYYSGTELNENCFNLFLI